MKGRDLCLNTHAGLCASAALEAGGLGIPPQHRAAAQPCLRCWGFAGASQQGSSSAVPAEPQQAAERLQSLPRAAPMEE